MQRRSFLKWVLGGVGSALGLLLGLGGLGLWMRGRQLRAAGPFKRVALLDQLEVDQPQKVPLLDIPAGTWALPPAQQMGEVWLIRRSPEKVEAYSARCPHQGGSIEFDGDNFVCPVHGATFDKACHRMGGRRNPAPRDMDALEVRQTPEPGSNRIAIEVRCDSFTPG